MVYKSKMLPSAAEELGSIVEGLSDYSPSATRAFLDDFEEKLETVSSGCVEYALSRFSELAALGYRTVIFDDYVFLYYIDGDTAVVAHIFSQRQDYARLV